MPKEIYLRIFEGENFITFEGITAYYEVEKDWIEECLSHNLLENPQHINGEKVFPFSTLDRVALIKRLCLQHEADLRTIALFLEIF